MDNVAYLTAQQPLLKTILAKLDCLIQIATDPNETADVFDFCFADFHSFLNDVTEFSISTPGFSALTDLSPDSLMTGLCQRTAQAMRAPFACLSFGGSSHSLLMTIGKILPGWMNGDKASLLLVDPLCHQSVLGGLDIGRWGAVKLHRTYCKALGVMAPITLETVKAAVEDRGSHNVAALIYNPISYDGFRNIMEENKIFVYCLEHNIKVICDFSWSPFYGFQGYDGRTGSLIDHAHISICSPHKKGLFASPVSIILYRDQALEREFVDAGRLGWVTTSPSYGSLMLVDFRLTLIETDVISEQLTEIISISEHLRSEINRISPQLKVIEPDAIGGDYQDPAHLLISSGDSGFDCRKLTKWLGQNARLDLEKSTKQTALFLVAPSHQPVLNQIISHFSEACAALEINGAPS